MGADLRAQTGSKKRRGRLLTSASIQSSQNGQGSASGSILQGSSLSSSWVVHIKLNLCNGVIGGIAKDNRRSREQLSLRDCHGQGFLDV